MAAKSIENSVAELAAHRHGGAAGNFEHTLYFADSSMNVCFSDDLTLDARDLADQIVPMATAVIRAARASLLKGGNEEDVCAALAGAELLGNLAQALRFHADMRDELAKPRAPHEATAIG